MPLRETDLLDPLPGDGHGAIPGAVRLAAAEMAARSYELPPRGAPVRILARGPEDAAAAAAAAQLAAMERLPQCVDVAALGLSAGVADAAVRYRLWRPTPWLVTALALLGRHGPAAAPSAGRLALDVACGVGRDAVFLAAGGWRVTAADWLPDALERARVLERRYAPPAAVPVGWACQDLETTAGDPLAGPAGPFALVTGFRFLHRPLFPRLAGALAPGGALVYETFTEAHRERYGKPGRRAFALAEGELRALVSGLEVLHYAEGWHDGAHTARVLAVRA